MAVYCYRSQINRLVEANSLTDSYGAPLCGRNFEDDDFQLDHDISGCAKGIRICIIINTSFS